MESRAATANSKTSALIATSDPQLLFPIIRFFSSLPLSALIRQWTRCRFGTAIPRCGSALRSACGPHCGRHFDLEEKSADLETATRKVGKPKSKIVEKLKSSFRSLFCGSWSLPDRNNSALLCGLMAAWLGIFGLWALLFYYIVLCAVNGPTWLAFLLSIFGLPSAWSLLKLCYRKTVEVAVEFENPAEKKENQQIETKDGNSEKRKNCFGAVVSAIVATDRSLKRWCGILYAIDDKIIIFALLFFWTLILGFGFACVYTIVYVCIFDGPYIVAILAFLSLWMLKFFSKKMYEISAIEFANIKKKHLEDENFQKASSKFIQRVPAKLNVE